MNILLFVLGMRICNRRIQTTVIFESDLVQYELHKLRVHVCINRVNLIIKYINYTGEVCVVRSGFIFLHTSQAGPRNQYEPPPPKQQQQRPFHYYLLLSLLLSILLLLLFVFGINDVRGMVVRCARKNQSVSLF